MSQLDSLLRIVAAQGADELRLGSDRTPSMFSAGVAKKLTIPATPTGTLLDLFGEILGAPRREALKRDGLLEILHEAPGLGAWTIRVTARPGEADAIDAVIRRGTRPGAAAAPPEASVPAPVAVAAAPAATVSAAPTPSVSPSTDRLPGALASLAARAVAMGASDLHLADGEAPTIRVDGRLSRLPIDGGVELQEPLAASFGELLDVAAKQRLAERSSCDLGVALPSGGRARVNLYRTMRGLAAAVRFLPRAVRTLEELGAPVPLDDLASLGSGLVLATGATGSGKSTTLAAIASLALRRRSIVLVTLEDPIEHDLTPTDRGATSLVRQRQIGREVPDFATGLRDALREDPDVILIGEMRDPESIALALTAAETGHLVLASLHARSAASAVDRIVDATPGGRQSQVRQQLADSLRAVVAHRLLPREGGGRVLAAEVLRNTAAVGAAIREGKTGALKSAMQGGRAAGMIPLERSLADLVRARAITSEVARQAADDPETLASYLGDRRPG